MIQELLKTGKENAISTPDLLALCGFDSLRELRRVVSRERRAGAVILSNCKGGYYLAGNRDEVEEFVRLQDKKARSIMVAIQSARRYLQTVDGQLIFDEGGVIGNDGRSKEEAC